MAVLEQLEWGFHLLASLLRAWNDTDRCRKLFDPMATDPQAIGGRRLLLGL